MLENPVGDAGQDPNDPYSTSGLKDKLLKEIEAAITELKEHPGDITTAMNKIFGDMQSIQGLLVGQTSETQGGLTTAITGIANLQKFGSIKPPASGDPATQVQDINPFTGKPRTTTDASGDPNGKPMMVSPERAFQDECLFLLNSPNTKAKLDCAGKPIPAIGADGQPMKNKDGSPKYLTNPLYTFTHTKGNDSVAQQLKSAVEGAITSLDGGSDFPATFKETDPPNQGYDYSSGQVPTSGDTGQSQTPTSGESVSITGDQENSSGGYPTGCIANMWSKANPPAPASGKAPTTPNSSILNSFQSALGTLSQAGTASSSTLQAFIKLLTSNMTASQGNYNKALTATISQLKVMVQAQKTG